MKTSTLAAAETLEAVSTERERVSILTAGKDSVYALGLLGSLVSKPLQIEFVANAEMATSPLASAPNVEYYNLRPDQSEDAPLWRKVTRVLAYYWALVRYAAWTESKLFHILWFNKFESFDNIVLVLYYKLLGKRLVYTAHNVSTRDRDGKGTLINRLSLRFLYRNVDQIFIHTDQMKSQLMSQFGVEANRVTVIPFGVNNVTPRSDMSRGCARCKLGIQEEERTLLFFGNIAHYKGLEIVVDALEHLPDCRLIIAGRVKGDAAYWTEIEKAINRKGLAGRVLKETRYIPEDEVEVYFKAADVLIVPYRKISQSGVMFLSYSFGLPVIASDAGALAESVVAGVTGYVFRSGDTGDLIRKVQTYLSSDLFQSLDQRREGIIRFVNDKHSWTAVADCTYDVYARTARWTVELSAEECLDPAPDQLL
jgi:D-inositol-3-phosphate glycosyltransferase